MEGPREAIPRLQDSYLPEGDDIMSINFHELIICARCLGRYANGGYRDTGLDLPPGFIESEEAASVQLISYFLRERRQIKVHVGEKSILRMDANGLFAPNDSLTVGELIETVDMPIVGQQGSGFITIEDFCKNLHDNGAIELI
ncbi:MAG: hypothetical protein ACXWLH_01060 [Candidatus Saccharimonadales bacterium]